VKAHPRDRLFFGVWDMQLRKKFLAKFDIKRGEGRRVTVGTWSVEECMRDHGVPLELANKICQSAAAECMEGYLYAREIAYPGERGEAVGFTLLSFCVSHGETKAAHARGEGGARPRGWGDLVENPTEAGFCNWFVSRVSAGAAPGAWDAPPSSGGCSRMLGGPLCRMRRGTLSRILRQMRHWKAQMGCKIPLFMWRVGRVLLGWGSATGS